MILESRNTIYFYGFFITLLLFIAENTKTQTPQKTRENNKKIDFQECNNATKDTKKDFLYFKRDLKTKFTDKKKIKLYDSLGAGINPIKFAKTKLGLISDTTIKINVITKYNCYEDILNKNTDYNSKKVNLKTYNTILRKKEIATVFYVPRDSSLKKSFLSLKNHPKCKDIGLVSYFRFDTPFAWGDKLFLEANTKNVDKIKNNYNENLNLKKLSIKDSNKKGKTYSFVLNLNVENKNIVEISKKLSKINGVTSIKVRCIKRRNAKLDPYICKSDSVLDHKPDNK